MATLVEGFVDALGRDATDRTVLAAVLDLSVREAQAAWPAVNLSAEIFIRHLASRIPERDEPPEVALEKLHMADLYLACACARGDTRAMEAFDARYFVDLGIALQQMRLAGDLLDEVKQQIRVQLFVTAGDEIPDIALYAGRGELRLWVRSIGVRAALKILRQGKHLRPDGQEALLTLSGSDDDLELAHLKEMSSAEFKAAFVEAVATLTTRQRNLLRHHLVDTLSIDEVGRIYRVHRATAARWIASARDELMTRTLRFLRARLDLGPSELESLVRLVRSQLDLSLYRVLGTEKRKAR